MSTVDIQTAKLDFDRLALAWDLDTDIESMDEDDCAGFKEANRRLVRAIQSGDVTVSEDGKTVEMVLSEETHGKTAIEFKMPRGSAYISTDKHKDRKAMHKVQTFMSEMTGEPEKFFSALPGNDYKRAQSLVMLFLGS